MLKPPTRRQPLGDPRQRAIPVPQKIRKIVRRRLPLHIGTQRQNHLDRLRCRRHPLQQRWNPQIIRRNPIQRRKLPPKTMISPSKRTGPLKRQHIRRLLHHTKNPVVPIPVIAQPATILRREKPANGAKDDRLTRRHQRTRQRRRIRLRTLQQPHRDPLRTARPNTGQAFQLTDKDLNGFGKISAGHESVRKWDGMERNGSRKAHRTASGGATHKPANTTPTRTSR